MGHVPSYTGYYIHIYVCHISSIRTLEVQFLRKIRRPAVPCLQFGERDIVGTLLEQIRYLIDPIIRSKIIRTFITDSTELTKKFLLTIRSAQISHHTISRDWTLYYCIRMMWKTSEFLERHFMRICALASGNEISENRWRTGRGGSPTPKT